MEHSNINLIVRVGTVVVLVVFVVVEGRIKVGVKVKVRSGCSKVVVVERISGSCCFGKVYSL